MPIVNSTMMSNDEAPSLPRYYNHTSLGSVLETRCRAAIDAFEGLQIRNAVALLASAKERAIEAASNIAGDHSFRFFSSPLPQAPTITTNDVAVPADGLFAASTVPTAIAAVNQPPTGTDSTKPKVNPKSKTNTLQKNWKEVLNNDIFTFSRPATFNKEEVDVCTLNVFNHHNQAQTLPY